MSHYVADVALARRCGRFAFPFGAALALALSVEISFTFLCPTHSLQWPLALPQLEPQRIFDDKTLMRDAGCWDMECNGQCHRQYSVWKLCIVCRGFVYSVWILNSFLKCPHSNPRRLRRGARGGGGRGGGASAEGPGGGQIGVGTSPKDYTKPRQNIQSPEKIIQSPKTLYKDPSY